MYKHSRPFDARRHNQHVYRKNSSSLQRKLQAIHETEGLTAAMRDLLKQQTDAGFISDEMSDVLRCRMIDPNNRSRFYTVQYNAHRISRFHGAGRRIPPAGWRSVNDGCFLCFDNVVWQQRLLEMGFRLSLAGTAYVAWPNPFPFMPNHLTVATVDHVPQCWIAGRGIEGVASQMLDLAKQLPGWIVMYNGDRAGASNPHHAHFQAFTRWPGNERFPLEAARLRPKQENRISLVNGYPISVFAMRAEFDQTLGAVVELADAWAEICGPSVSANLVAMHDEGSDRVFDFYFTPRNRHFSRSPGLSGMIGGLEILGELVLSSEEDKELVSRARADVAFIEAVLASVEPPEIGRLVDKLGLG